MIHFLLYIFWYFVDAKNTNILFAHKNQGDSSKDDSISFSSIIEKRVKESLKQLHRTKSDDDPMLHKAFVCIICDSIIHGSTPLRCLKRDQIRKHKHRLSVESYEKYYKMSFPESLKEDYHVPGFPGLLLSPRSRKSKRGWVTCPMCRSSMSPKHEKTTNPPKYSIANGFVIGTFPKKIRCTGDDAKVSMRNVDAEEDIPEVLRALIAPVRPHGCIFAYTGGARKSIRGHFSFFELNQVQMEKVLKHQIGMLGRGDNIYCMLSGRFTPKQRAIVQKRMMFPPDLYFGILSWWINESGYPGF